MSLGKLFFFWFLLVGFYLILILGLNQGHFVYTLDDAYIHLAMAEQMASGSYGINAGEAASASSSILWPLLLVPFHAWSLGPLLLNLISGAFALWGCAKIFNLVLNDIEAPRRKRWHWMLLLGCVPLFNLTGLAFTGMEHSLQVALCIFILYGLLLGAIKGRVPVWLYGCLTVAPLIRYECLAVVLPALLLLLLWKNIRGAVCCGLVIVGLLGGYSLYLRHLGLDPLPSSVLIKSSLGQGSLHGVLTNTVKNLMDRRGVLFSGISFLIFIWVCMSGQPFRMRSLGFAVCVMSGLHLLFGRFGWYNRYEIYLWAVVILFGLVLLIPWVLHWQSESAGDTRGRILLFLGLCLNLFLVPQYWANLFTLPLASRNIYHQQFQMARFAQTWVQGAVAVNDLGLVSWRNPDVVLDLWGLGNEEARKHRLARKEGWIQDLADRHDVRAVMIYKSWFPEIPESWVELGSLKLSGPVIMLGGRDVTFFATTEAEAQHLKTLLPDFVAQLPPGVHFE